MKSANWDSLPEVLTVEEVSKVLRLSRGAIYNGVRCGDIPSYRVGRRIVIDKRALMKRLSGKKN